MADSYDAVIISSGLWDAIPALRLAQAGKSVLVIEQERAFTEQDFKQLWDFKYSSRFTGITTSNDSNSFFGAVMDCKLYYCK
jgi:choline dehydrogenase-like flavoprotein